MKPSERESNDHVDSEEERENKKKKRATAKAHEKEAHEEVTRFTDGSIHFVKSNHLTRTLGVIFLAFFAFSCTEFDFTFATTEGQEETQQAKKKRKKKRGREIRSWRVRECLFSPDFSRLRRQCFVSC